MVLVLMVLVLVMGIVMLLMSLSRVRVLRPAAIIVVRLVLVGATARVTPLLRRARHGSQGSRGGIGMDGAHARGSRGLSAQVGDGMGRRVGEELTRGRG